MNDSRCAWPDTKFTTTAWCWGKRWPHLCYHQQDIFAMIFRLIRTPHDILQSAFSKTHVSAITATIPPMTEGWRTEHCFPLLHSILLSCLSLLSGSQDHEWISPSINKKRNSRHQRLICIIVCPIFRQVVYALIYTHPPTHLLGSWWSEWVVVMAALSLLFMMKVMMVWDTLWPTQESHKVKRLH